MIRYIKFVNVLINPMNIIINIIFANINVFMVAIVVSPIKIIKNNIDRINDIKIFVILFILYPLK